VLEHVHDPVSLLHQVGERLRVGGVLYVDVPDVAAHASIQDLHLAHCNHFSVHTLGAALARGGLETLRIMQHRPPTLPPSLFAIARRREVGATIGPVEPDPAGEEHARRVAAIDAGWLSRWRRPVEERREHSRRGGPREARSDPGRTPSDAPGIRLDCPDGALTAPAVDILHQRL
jgi:hypothetical protein